MAKQSTYKIEYVGKRVVDEYRGDRTMGDKYSVTNSNNATYYVMLSELYDDCTCPSFTHRQISCKHIEMVHKFRATEHAR